LPVADVAGLRPTSERIRETVFNWLAPTIEGSHCLDLFAGSGALGFEALSRGAATATFVESSPAAAAALRENASILEAEAATVLECDAVRFLQRRHRQQFDLVFLDPPFAHNLAEDLCRLLAASDLLADGARVYLERGRDQPLPDAVGEWRLVRDKTAGNVNYALLDTGKREPSE